MVLLRRFDAPAAYRGGYVSIGNFDGVHTGHRKIVQRVRALADAAHVPAVIMTFDPHPLELLRPKHVPPSLTTLEHKAELLEQAGATCVVAYPTDRKLLQLTPEEFFDAIIVAELRAEGIVEGPNFCFGKDRKGDIDTLQDLCRRRGVSLQVAEPVGGEAMVSSSTIRTLIVEGRLAEAVALLGHPYRLRGEVIGGARRGQTIGFPTANLAHIETLVPRDGVYGGIARVDGRSFAAAINIGPNPTFGESNRKVEVHLIDFAGDLYGRWLDIDLFEHLRETRKFESRERLTQQIALDVAAARALLSEKPAEKT
jgi:riboflavin kinase / FMN adenylyltransferase